MENPDATPQPARDAAEGAGDIARCLETIENAYNFTSDGALLAKCGEWKYLKRLLSAPPKPAPDAMREALAYASTNQIAACRCGSFPRLYGDGARPDDGYRSLWCQTCMEHVVEMKPNEREVIDYWNDLREHEHAAFSAPVPSGDEGSPDDIRALGWTVAVHNDYRQLGELHTFWLFTKASRAVKGEGMSDAQALNQVRRALSPSGTGAAEPVAWQKRNANNDWSNIEDCSDENLYALDKARWETRPLYIAPPVRGDREELYNIFKKYLPADAERDSFWQEVTEWLNNA